MPPTGPDPKRDPECESWAAGAGERLLPGRMEAPEQDGTTADFEEAVRARDMFTPDAVAGVFTSCRHMEAKSRAAGLNLAALRSAVTAW